MKIWVFDLCFDPPKTGNYARLFRIFQESRKKCKKSSEIRRFRNYSGGDKRDRPADLLNAIGFEVLDSMRNVRKHRRNSTI